MTPSHDAPFRGFRDHDESPFFRAPGRTPEETWNLSVDRLGEIIETLGARASAGPIQMSPALLCAWHREIFGELFPDDAGRLRRRRPDTWDPEHVLRAHPFVDGNLRATTVALNAGLLTLGLPRVRFNDLQLHDDLLGIAFIGKHDPYRPLAEHIAEIIGKPGAL